MCYGVRVKKNQFFYFWDISQNRSSAKNHETTSKTEAIFWNLKENWRKESAFIFWIGSSQKKLQRFLYDEIFFKNGPKKMPWTSYFTVWFWLFGACHVKNYCIWDFPFDSQPVWTMFKLWFYFLTFQHTIFLSINVLTNCIPSLLIPIFVVVVVNSE